MNIGNITSDNFNLDGNGKDIQIEVYEQLIEQLQQKNKQLKDNWAELKKYIKTEIPEDVFIDTEWFVAILDKMLELEQGSDNKC